MNAGMTAKTRGEQIRVEREAREARERAEIGEIAPAGRDLDRAAELVDELDQAQAPAPDESASPAPPGSPVPPGVGEDPRPEPPDPPAPPDGSKGSASWSVRPLGMLGKTLWFLTPSGQLHDTTARSLNKLGIMGLFEADQDGLRDAFPSYREVEMGDGTTKQVIAGFNAANGARELIRSAGEAGIFDPSRDLRGIGAWFADGDEPGDENELLVHFGDGIFHGGVYLLPGKHGRRVYPLERRAGRPADTAATIDEGRELLSFIETWRWSEPMAPILIVGWIAAAFVPACLDWRPSLWLSGDKGTGKSRLQELIEAVLGDTLVSTSDTTSAGLRAKLAGAALPVGIDEIEAEEMNSRAIEVVKLVRRNASRSSGGSLRGSADNRGAVEQKINAVFLLSSILRPPLDPQDIDRISMLELRPFEGGAAAAEGLRSRIRTNGEAGDRLRRRLVDRFDRHARTIAVAHELLSKRGHSSRAADQIGTLLAGAHVLLSDDEAAIEDLTVWCDEFEPTAAGAGESDQDQCLSKLLTSSVPNWRSGVQPNVGDVVEDLLDDGAAYDPSDLARIGLALVAADGRRDRRGGYLAIANRHNGLSRIFDGSHWGGGGRGGGAWPQSLERIEGAIKFPRSLKFGGMPARAVGVPIAALGLSEPSPNDPGGDGQAGTVPGASPAESLEEEPF